MIARHPTIRIAIAALLALASASAQAPLFDKPSRSSLKPPAVEYLYPEQLTLPAGKPSKVALHFRVAPGLHINSHTPSAEELIPTTLTIPDGSGVRLESAVYPTGADFALPIDPKTHLSVYTGEFVIQARIVATAGNHLVEAQLRYQACDQNTCMPPKTITAAIDVIGN
jgi:DsbC/DsbD-like thiol-disulfide interchange protein